MGQFTPVIPDEPSFRYIQQMAERDRQRPIGSTSTKLGRHESTATPITIVQVWGTAGTETVGDVLQASSGVLPGRLRRFKQGLGWASGFRIWIRFIDWEADDGAVFSVHGRCFVGMRGGQFRRPFNDVGELRTVYLCQAGEQTFLAQTTSLVTKGNTGTFKLYHGGETDSTFTQSAKAKGADVPANKWAFISRTHVGNWYASPSECP